MLRNLPLELISYPNSGVGFHISSFEEKVKFTSIISFTWTAAKRCPVEFALALIINSFFVIFSIFCHCEHLTRSQVPPTEPRPSARGPNRVIAKERSDCGNLNRSQAGVCHAIFSFDANPSLQ